MKNYLLFPILLFCVFCNTNAQKLPLDKWKYIQVDNSRQKWGDWGQPDWLRYFGLDMKDINKDGYQDIISGRYFYMNPGGNMQGQWTRSDLGMNVDGYFFVDIDGDEYADVIAEALPDVYWFEADNWQGTSWTCRKIGEIPKTDHGQGQGGRIAQIIKGGKDEIVLAAEHGIYAAQIPDQPNQISNWKFNLIIKTGSSEGVGVGDVDGDGDLDLAAGDMPENDKKSSKLVSWYENPGSIDKEWTRHEVGLVINMADRLEIADLNGDRKADIAVSEEMWPGLEPLANIFVFFNPGSGTEWKKSKVYTGFSVNNLDADDLDKDGDIDLVSCEHKGKEFKLLVLENDGRGNFKLTVPDKGHESHLGTQLADLDSDGDLDIVSIAWDNYKFLHVWRNDAINKNLSWKHYSTKDGSLPPTNGGQQQTSSLVADIDKDGVNEFFITDRSVTPSVIMYKYKGGKWDRFNIDDAPLKIEAGNAVLDIDNDGDLDIIFPGDSQINEIYWWENPFPTYDQKKNWKRYTIKKSGGAKHHDMMTGDFDNDGKDELVFWNQGGGALFIAEVPADPKNTAEWPRKAIYTYNKDSEMNPRGGVSAYPVFRGRNEHEGLAKADIDGDGIVDIIGGGRWFKYTGDGNFRENIIDASFTFSRTAVGQFIEGGRPEVILSPGDGTGSMLLYEWKELKNKENKGMGTGTWVPQKLIETLYDGHSIDVLDFNKDGHADIFSAEMRLDPKNPGSIRILLGDGKGNFLTHIVADEIGCHEGKIADLDGDGDYDILSKPYNWDTPRLDVFINETVK